MEPTCQADPVRIATAKSSWCPGYTRSAAIGGFVHFLQAGDDAGEQAIAAVT
jgi:hypothetical protein